MHISKQARNIVKAASSVLLLSPMITLASDRPEITLSLTSIVDRTTPARINALKDWMASKDCDLEVVAEAKHNLNVDFIFTIKDSATAKASPPIITATTRNNIPLKSMWLVNSSRGITHLSAIAGERIATQESSSLLGYQEPMRLLEEANINKNSMTPFLNSGYSGALVLLLHGDVFAATAPAPLAIPWANANNLSILSESKTIYVAGIWNEGKTEMTPNCVTAFTEIKRENYRDKKMKLFPEWLEGFEISN